MSAHTPGEWRVSPLDGRTCGPSRLLVTSGTTIAQMQAVAIVTLRTGETDANARLIAAAPELLDALKGCEAVLATSAADAFQVTRQLSDVELGKLWIAVTEQARTAIAKAEGQA